MMRKACIVAVAALLTGLNLAQAEFVSQKQGWGEEPIVGQAGAYAVQTPMQAGQMGKFGFRLAVKGYVEPDSTMAQAMRDASVHYIDPYPMSIAYAACENELKKKGTCALPSQDAAMKIIVSHLAKMGGDRQIVGFWVLDDYPGGDIRPLLVRVHAAIDESNKVSGFFRPAICAFGGVLDENPPGFLTTLRRSQQLRSPTNYDPRACDMVAVYLYGAGRDTDAANIDWNMGTSLPGMMTALRARGWDQSRVPLIGMPQAFVYLDASPKAHYVRPRSADIAVQAAAFCRSGAVALVAYTWDDRYPADKLELSNSQAYREGLRSGFRECKKLWDDERHPVNKYR